MLKTILVEKGGSVTVLPLPDSSKYSRQSSNASGFELSKRLVIPHYGHRVADDVVYQQYPSREEGSKRSKDRATATNVLQDV